MAFGLGYNKTKILGAAEKCVMQGKIPAAIAEYTKILENEPRDLTILNIVGDLYLRINKTDEALKCFYKLGEAYLDDGFTRNAIAVYRRILRADANQIDAVLRVAELYTLQGQLGDARSHYQLAIDYYGRLNDNEKCAEVMEKTLLLDPENVPIRERLAQLYLQLNRKGEAATLFLAVAEAQADQGRSAEAEKSLKQARLLGVPGEQVALLQARILIDTDQPREAAEVLDRLPADKLDKAALNLQFHAYSSLGDLDRAAQVAQRLFHEHDDLAGLAMTCEQLVQQSRYSDALRYYQGMAEPLIAQRNISPLVEGVKKISAADPSNVEALQLLRDVFQKSDEVAEIQDIDERIAHLAEERGDQALVREMYAELSHLEPDNSHYRQKLQHVSGAAAPEEPARREVGFGEEMYQAPAIEQHLSAEEQELLKTATNESDLYITYRQFEKAIQPLEALLPRLPSNITLHERLLDLYKRSGAGAKAAGCCAALAKVYREAGDQDRAQEYGALEQKHRAAAPAAAPGAAEFAVPAAPEFAVPAAPEVQEFQVGGDAAFGLAVPEPPVAAAPAAEASEAGVREVDLSGWESMMAPPTAGPSREPAVAPPSDLAGGARQIEVYLQAGQISEATTLLSELQERYAGAPELDVLAERVAMASMGIVAQPEEAPAPAEPVFAPFETAPAPAPPPEAEKVQEFQFAEFPGLAAAEAAPAAAPPEMPVWPETTPASLGAEMPVPEAPPPAMVPPPAMPAVEPAPAPAPDVDLVLHLEQQAPPAGEVFELSVEEEAAPAAASAAPAAAPALPAAAPPAPAAAPPAPAAAPLGFEGLVGALDEELAGLGPPAAPAAAPPAAAAPPPAPVPAARTAPPPSPARPAPPAPKPPKPEGAGALAEVFEEFKEGMEEAGAEEDIETHFNMGVAFKEMHLYDEAIGEFQKAYQAAERAKSYSNYVRCCTLLAHCFREKGLPPLAVRWLENALKAPALEQDDILALRYEIGIAHEEAGNKKAALDSFLEVYALNIDYRDVAERIRELQGK
jgi:tetratricopeptide (TPR) repeat protein